MKKVYYSIVLITFIFSSCVSNTSLLYMQEANNSIPTEYTQKFLLDKSGYKLQEGDILQVQIVSLDPDINEIFGESSKVNMPINNVGSPLVNLLGFVINSKGNVKLPIIGDVFVLGMSVSSAEVAVQEAVDKYLKGASATCKLLSPRVTVLGEVRNPGSYPIYRNELNIFEALGLAGDLLVTGDRGNIRLLRPNGNEQIMHIINIRDKNVIEQEGFIVQPNDVIYVSSTEATSKRSNIPVSTSLLTTILSIVTTGLVIFNSIKN